MPCSEEPSSCPVQRQVGTGKCNRRARNLPREVKIDSNGRDCGPSVVRSAVVPAQAVTELARLSKPHAGAGSEKAWDELMAESWSLLQTSVVAIDELLRHPAAFPCDMVAYGLASSSVYVALVALDSCESQERKPSGSTRVVLTTHIGLRDTFFWCGGFVALVAMAALTLQPMLVIRERRAAGLSLADSRMDPLSLRPSETNEV